MKKLVGLLLDWCVYFTHSCVLTFVKLAEISFSWDSRNCDLILLKSVRQKNVQPGEGRDDRCFDNGTNPWVRAI